MTVSITTASKGSKILGISSIVGFVVLVLLAFFVTEPDIRFHPDTGEELILKEGRYGPYISDGKE